MSEQDAVALAWNNYIGVTILTLISYDYLLLFEKEVKFLWKRQWSLMSCLYIIVRYLGLFLAMVCGTCMYRFAQNYRYLTSASWRSNVYT
ncbi:hypothetical protein M405DRAFT_290465 [Rhizopogon salebrosus TDB-379]|nr:hypothetical protein M405DRAFT_290465 [Rhizopogon salebrosus TDB-379]